MEARDKPLRLIDLTRTTIASPFPGRPMPMGEEGALPTTGDISPDQPGSAPKRLHVITWGCQMNVYDSARMADVLRPLGYAPAPWLPNGSPRPRPTRSRTAPT